MFKKITFFLSLIITISGCGSNENNTSSETPQPVAKTPAQQQVYLPSLPMEELKLLWDNSNQVDYIYYELPMSTSLDEQASIQTQLRYISDTPVPLSIKNNCKAIARIFYKQDGEDIIESDLYFSENCYFYVFFKEGKPVYSNLMTDVGKEYFGNMLRQILGQSQK